MPAPFNKGATLIALRPLKAAGRSFAPGDHFTWRHYAMTERRVAQMIEQHQLGELTQEAYDFALAQRQAGDVVPHGFTVDGLTALGIEVPAINGADLEKDPVDDVAKDYDSFEPLGAYLVGARKAGVVMTYDIFDAEQNRLNHARLRGERARDQFIEMLDAEKTRIAGEPPAAAEPDLADADYGAV